MKEYIPSSSSLCVFDEYSFICVYNGTYLQLSNEDGSVLFHSKDKGEVHGYFGIISLEGRMYFAIENYKRISLIKPCYA